MPTQALWIVAVLGAGTLFGVFFRMRGGFGPFNLKVIGIVLLTVLTSLLAIAHSESFNAAMGILGAVAGYLFGRADEQPKSMNQSGVDASAAQFGDNAKIAGRDLNETINNIQGRLDQLGHLLTTEGAKIDKIVATQLSTAPEGPFEYVLNTVFERGTDRLKDGMQRVIGRWEREGWQFMGFSSDYQGTDGVILLFRRPSRMGETDVAAFHGSKSEPVRT